MFSSFDLAFFFSSPVQCLVTVHLKWESGGDCGTLLFEGEMFIMLCPQNCPVFSDWFFFSTSAAVFRELHFVVKNMDVFNGTVSPNCCAGRSDKWMHSYLYTWWQFAASRVSSQHERHSWGGPSFSPSLTNLTYAKQYIGCIFCRQLGEKKNTKNQASHFLPVLAIQWADAFVFRLAVFPALGIPRKKQTSIPGTGKAGACEEPLGPQPATERVGTAAGIDLCLRNRRTLYYIIIDVAGKCHRRSAARYLLCCIVSLVCVGPLCFASCVPIACLFIPCAF